MNLLGGGTATHSVLKSELAFQAFPNPVSDQLTLKANSPIREIQLLDLNGRVLYQAAGLNDNQKNIPVHPWRSGLYIVRVSFDQGVLSEKILIKP